MVAKWPLILLNDLENWHTLKQKGSVDEAEYLSVKKKIIKQILQSPYVSPDCIEDAEKLQKSSAITAEEFQAIKQQAMDCNDPDVNSEKKHINWWKPATVFLQLIHGVLFCFTILLKVITAIFKAIIFLFVSGKIFKKM